MAVGLNLIWAIGYPYSKQVLEHITPLALTGWRTILAALFLLPFVRKSQWPKTGFRNRDWVMIALLGVVGCLISGVLQYLGTERTLSSNVAVLVGIEPVCVTLLAALFLSEPLTKRVGVASLLAFAGVVCVTVDPATLDLISSRYLLGNLLVLSAIFCYAGYTAIAKPLTDRYHSLLVTLLSFFFAAAAFVPIISWVETRGLLGILDLNSKDLFALGIIAIPGTAIGYAGWNWLLTKMSATELAFSLFVQPAAGAAASYWMLGDPLAPTFFVGAALILGAMGLVLLPQPRLLSHNRTQDFT